MTWLQEMFLCQECPAAVTWFGLRNTDIFKMFSGKFLWDNYREAPKIWYDAIFTTGLLDLVLHDYVANFYLVVLRFAGYNTSEDFYKP